MIMIMSKSDAATQRLIVPISPAEKRAVSKKASARGLSMAEFARRALLRYDPTGERDAEEAQLRALVGTFRQVHAETLAQLDRTDAALDAAIARLEAAHRKDAR
jgi:hypothetical protein